MTSQATSELAADPRVRAGMAAQLEERSRRLAAGDRPLGWKLGFGADAARAKLGIPAPLIGFLTDGSLIEPGVAASIGDWKLPLLEPEVAVRVGPAPGDGEIESLGLAIELADLDSEPDDVERILAGNVFHRGLVLGPTGSAAVAELRGEVTRAGGEPAAVADPQAATGELSGLVVHVAELLAAFGLSLEPGEIVICGSIVAPLAVAPGESVTYRLEPLGELALALSE